MRRGAYGSAIPEAEYRHVLGHFPTGVTVVTAFDGDEPVGMACNSVASVSLEPPLVLFCVAHSSTTWPLLRGAGTVCINVMAGHHAEACRHFSRRHVDRFEAVAWHGRAHGPGIDDAVAWIDCALEAEHEAGDHTVVVARVSRLELGEHAREPLVFCHGEYRPLSGGDP